MVDAFSLVENKQFGRSFFIGDAFFEKFLEIQNIRREKQYNLFLFIQSFYLKLNN